MALVNNTTTAGHDAYHIVLSDLVAVINGLLSPVIILLTVITNCLVCVVLLRPSMRTPTNVVLVAMAVSDILTGVCPLAPFFYFYTGALVDGRRHVYVPYDLCSAYFALVDFLPTAFHTASIWLTVMLAVHRYICVCCSGGGVESRVIKSPSTIRQEQMIVRIIVLIFSLAVLSQLCRFFEYRSVNIDLV